MLILHFNKSTKASRSIFKIETKIKITVCFRGDHLVKYTITVVTPKFLHKLFTTSKRLIPAKTSDFRAFSLVTATTSTTCISIVHTDLPALEFFPVYCFHHFISGS